MRHLASKPRLLVPILLIGLAACSRTDDRAGGLSAGKDAASVAGGPTTLKPGVWKTVTKTPFGPETLIRCVPEGYDPGAETARKVSPCGNPKMIRTVHGFRLEHVCEKNHITYELSGQVRGDFVTNAQTELDLEISAFGHRRNLHVTAVSTYQGPCEPGGEPEGGPAGETPAP